MLTRTLIAAAFAASIPLGLLGATEAPAPPSTAGSLDAAAVSAAQAALAVDLLVRLSAEDPSANLVLSPASVAAALSVAAIGASDEGRAAIARTLGFKDRADGPDHILQSMRDLPNSDADPLAMAVRIVFDRSLALQPDAAGKLESRGADHGVDDLSTAPAVERINAWVAGATRGAIPTILDAPTGPGFVSLGALHFKAKWRTAFDPAETRALPFRRADGAADPVPTMRLAPGPGWFRTDDRFVAVDLPYSDERYGLVLVAGRNEAGVTAADLPHLKDWLAAAGFEDRKGDVMMPRFRLSDGRELLAALDHAGLSPARLKPDAFFGFTREPLEIRRIVQKTALEVDEAGTTAAAATAVIAERSIDPAFVHVVADAPFLVALRDRSTGLLLIVGLVGDPGGVD
ncbi:serpin family protein [Chthonobacter rhizosphaerae]|uniref:serpin family protein n=1 Tax=Chthonobacter rhizosphaerae TaxID=2735553 RepID=UPI0015EFA5D4|nr:serpin family protein [Chthonobacter rhizosphaerae]